MARKERRFDIQKTSYASAHVQRRREQLLNWALLVTPSGQSLQPFR
jgi:hypothetical protein